MKENNIERDIHLLESYSGMTHKMNDNQGRPKLDQAIEHILSDYKRVLKENEELKEKIREHTLLISPYYVKENFIPVQKIENLIKELGQDDINMTRKYKEKKNITGELLGIDKVRVRAYREKTREINEKLHKLLSD